MKKGFTLIEILAVVTIIGLIFILVIPKIATSLKNKKTDVDTTTNNIVLAAAKSYVADNRDKFDKEESNTYCLPISTLTKKEYLESPVKNVTDDVDITNTKSVKITYNKGFKYEIVDKKECSAKKVELATKYLIKKTNPITITNYTDGDIHEMYTFEHEATEQTPALTDYRYIGSDPNNYVEFNNELWRIIGVFSVEDENGNWEERIKIIRNDTLGSKKMNDSSNEWVNSVMQVYLNDTYKIKDDYLKLTSSSKYYLGGIASYPNGDGFYNAERSLNAYNVERSKYWIGLVGLVYPSDYVYTFALNVDNICYDTPNYCDTSSPNLSWLYKSQHTMIPYISRSGSFFRINGDGKIAYSAHAYSGANTYPVIYLSSNVKITSGDGTIDNAYKLST